MNFKKIIIILLILFLSLECSFATSSGNGNIFNQIGEFSFDKLLNQFNGFSFDFLKKSDDSSVNNFRIGNVSVFNNHAKYTFNSSDLVKKFNTRDQYSVQILSDGKPVGAGEKVLLRVNGVDYERATDANGTVHLNINLLPGNYIVFCEYNNYKTYNNIRVI